MAGFSDVSSDAWDAGHAETVVEKGLFSGNEDGNLGPEDNMTYAQFLVVLSQFSGESLPASDGARYQSYVDWAGRRRSRRS
ncbi:MAG: S-layer homology domain-containing protein [Lawsonibacter sp.]